MNKPAILKAVNDLAVLHSKPPAEVFDAILPMIPRLEPGEVALIKSELANTLAGGVPLPRPVESVSPAELAAAQAANAKADELAAAQRAYRDAEDVALRRRFRELKQTNPFAAAALVNRNAENADRIFPGLKPDTDPEPPKAA